MAMQLGHEFSRDLLDLVRLERRAFAAKVRMVRAVLGWSQSELGVRVGLTQRAIHKIEQGETEPRRASVRAIEQVWREQGVEFENLPDSGFRVSVYGALLDRPSTAASPRQHADAMQLGVTAIGQRSPAYRA
jgi:transcriptional regulator with XRE-family HTH domain